MRIQRTDITNSLFCSGEIAITPHTYANSRFEEKAYFKKKVHVTQMRYGFAFFLMHVFLKQDEERRSLMLRWIYGKKKKSGRSTFGAKEAKQSTKKISTIKGYHTRSEERRN